MHPMGCKALTISLTELKRVQADMYDRGISAVCSSWHSLCLMFLGQAGRGFGSTESTSNQSTFRFIVTVALIDRLVVALLATPSPTVWEPPSRPTVTHILTSAPICIICAVNTAPHTHRRPNVEHHRPDTMNACTYIASDKRRPPKRNIKHFRN